jgi:Barstar (barnase inhibitor)
MTKPVFEIDGKNLDSLDSFFDEVGRKLGTASWGRNLDAFNDIPPRRRRSKLRDDTKARRSSTHWLQSSVATGQRATKLKTV